MKYILVATDGSEGADRAVKLASSLAAGLGARLAILTVGELKPTLGKKEFVRAEHTTLADMVEEISRDILDRGRDTARAAGVKSVTTHHANGDPTRMILDTISNESVDMAVLGRTSHGRLDGLLEGNVPEEVVRLAPCPVVIVP